MITGGYDTVTCPICGKGVNASDWPAHYNKHTTDQVNSSPAQSVSKTSDDIQFSDRYTNRKYPDKGTGRSD